MGFVKLGRMSIYPVIHSHRVILIGIADAFQRTQLLDTRLEFEATERRKHFVYGRGTCSFFPCDGGGTRYRIYLGLACFKTRVGGQKNYYESITS